jgi:redox-sensitive bicupin YhaK (pirin superfamily)
LFDGSEHATLPIAPGRRAYAHVVRGGVTINGVALGGGDALKMTEVGEVTLSGGAGAEVLVFDLPVAMQTH